MYRYTCTVVGRYFSPLIQFLGSKKYGLCGDVVKLYSLWHKYGT